MFKIINGGVCAAKGYRANGLNCGLNKNPDKNDLGLYMSDVPAKTAGVYTTNKVKGAPIIVTKAHLESTGGVSRAVIMNSKNANTCNADGVEKAEKMCSLAADALGISENDVLVASTGVIGQILPIEPIADNIQALADGLAYDGNERAATAIMTTDTVKKEYAVEFELGGKACRMGGMAKGSGMIHPNMATTLNFITTDADVSSEMLQQALSEIVKITYNCLSVDGDTSTNDMIILQANGLAENAEIASEGEYFDKFKEALYIVMSELTKMLAKDGEGATKLLECTVKGAPDTDCAITVAKSVIRSPLLKCAMFGADANWGRVLCAVGYAEAEFDINKVDVDFRSKAGVVAVCRNGAGVSFSEDLAKEILTEENIYIDINLNAGNSEAKAWGCDLTYDYVKINGDYRS
ncbi:MAG: bifunctional glutamate N-acetyltransferase/amino-acid acetyltransferase ArgJ [Clostridia bacterium]|nr:bifunctional glutamate N-acetyltransferase/amino-acid acetyltransferase ArgJ [Clostridia bacterium]